MALDIVQEIMRERAERRNVEGRQTRRAARAEGFGQIRAAIEDLRETAAVQPLHQRLGYSWNMQESEAYDDAWVPIGNMHPAAAAVSLVRDVFSEFEVDAVPSFQYVGMHRESGRGAHSIQDGHIEIEVALKPGVGRKTEYLTVPVRVAAGYMLRPGVVLIHDQVQILAQTLFDDILRKPNQDRLVAPQRGMYSPPGGLAKFNPTKWGSVGPRYQGPDRRAIQAAIHGVAVAQNEPRLISAPTSEPWQWSTSTPAWGGGRNDDRDSDYLDPAERTRPRFCPGMEVVTSEELEPLEVGGTNLWTVPSGARGVVLKDVDGTGIRFEVRLHDNGSSVIVPSTSIKAA